MGSARSDGTDGGSDAGDVSVLAAHKILIAGGFGAGKTTPVAAISARQLSSVKNVLTTLVESISAADPSPRRMVTALPPV